MTQDLRAAEWANIPFLNIVELLGWFRHLIQGKHLDVVVPELSETDIEEAVEIVHVYLTMYEIWDTSFFGSPIEYEAFRNVTMVKDQKLNLTNNMWKRHRLLIEPVIANCTNACTTFESIYKANRHNLTEDVMHILWAIRLKRFDFIPWLVFVITGNTSVWLTSSMVIGKAGCGEDYDKFKSRIMGRR